MFKFSLIVIISTMASFSVHSDENDYSQAPAPCLKVGDACKKAGFRVGGWKKGIGLWDDCINIVMQGRSRKEDFILKLPTLDPQIIASCKKARKSFGQGTLGTSVKESP